jgi:trehalose synthase
VHSWKDGDLTSREPFLRQHGVREVAAPVRALSWLESLIGPERYRALRGAAASASENLRGRTVWNVSSTSAGGGVAEMLQVLIGYTLDAGIDSRWLVMSGDPEFFAITKRIHNRLHGVTGDSGDLGRLEADHYADVTAANAASALTRVRRGDVVLLHDPQTAGMARPLVEAGASVIWRCHVGRARSNEWTDQAWSFLRDHLAPCAAFIFSLRAYIPSWIDESRGWVIPPSIDPFSPKNQELSEISVTRTLQRIGLLSETDHSPGTFARRDGSAGVVERRGSIVSVDGSPLESDVPVIIQVSRWDKLKDMDGVMAGFASGVAGRVAAQLVLVGPSVGDVTDDPEEEKVFAQCVATWEALPTSVRRQVRLVGLPMDDIDENAAMVNSLQRHATVVVQKSLEEGFGLTVAEGMWKGRAVVASNVGGIADQIAPGTGVLLEDPTDLSAFAQAVASLLERPDELSHLGARARQHVLDGFVGDAHLIRYARLMEALVSG